MSALLAVMLALGGDIARQGSPAVAAAQEPTLPFLVGERLTYDVRFGPLRVGQGSMEVIGTESIRGRNAYHTIFRVKGGTFFYRVDDVMESWFDTQSLSSLRFVQDQEEGGRSREKRFDIFPERAIYLETGKPGEKPSVHEPLDDGSFLYFVRTVPLTIGQTYEFHRYFRPDRNPVRIKVLRKEKVSVPAGTFNTIVVQPIIKTKGIFGEGGHAEVWLTDDASRMMVQLKSSLSFGSLNLYLKSYRLSQTPSAPAHP